MTSSADKGRGVACEAPGDEMTDKRYHQLMDSAAECLTPAERRAGWHFCNEWDGMLIHPSHLEADCCNCISKELLDRWAEQRRRDRESCQPPNKA